ncbi:MAG: NADH-quinone oxidoreductase subunit K [Alphaproteobacteria bacterium]|nr:NADH-quinone oxidoreductase subunit K [Alphaproteobacteria bacterium]MBU0799208.1 NADH-quinone oxidoreductase subunit K [Alphaproteobacteria bacterium]MBU0887541.1 NADH-quinone oxidoreductase subunit K [Alphaproteobacteria bacterium]MBU1814778.1 NADH-quinone oxidoreductase subunit K [Alphaproteobacteria bacterium]MBU2089681.1 NADH-quinone oxidoreductase subunit K [Alphaproteobacteria bacterium]
METLFAITIGILVAASVYLFLARDLPRMLIGFILLGMAVNLLILVAGRIGSIVPALVPAAETALLQGTANPLPQALVLTAIVIGFGLAAFALMLIVKSQRLMGTVIPEEMGEAEGDEAATGVALPGEPDRRKDAA